MSQRQVEATVEGHEGRRLLSTLMVGAFVGLIAAAFGLLIKFTLSFSLPESASSLGLLAVGVSAAVFSSVGLRKRNRKSS